jgi:hypothetical protein
MTVNRERWQSIVANADMQKRHWWPYLPDYDWSLKKRSKGFAVCTLQCWRAASIPPSHHAWRSLGVWTSVATAEAAAHLPALPRPPGWRSLGCVNAALCSENAASYPIQRNRLAVPSNPPVAWVILPWRPVPAHYHRNMKGQARELLEPPLISPLGMPLLVVMLAFSSDRQLRLQSNN